MAKKKAKRDACYHKVKSRYKVWPSAYASGALSKCRKVGAKNWGNSKKAAEGGVISAIERHNIQTTWINLEIETCIDAFMAQQNFLPRFQ